ncbi:ABC-ATPase domain-containing protein [uncultured Tessaracoccus sp.]|uniref:ABC-ATPase domain-containing protein n=1 Tax=uncultured Tessaracoccus sp. TaxID=905023 RepID=UPI002630DA8A|nr:ABC-ATPase domain-containing protein [uncultured Tessaracoccus sp.]
MRDRTALERTLAQIDGRGYASYKQLAGTYQFGTFRLAIDQVQVDPYAPPSRMRIILGPQTAGLPADLTNDAIGRRAVADFLTRQFLDVAHRLLPEPSGTGNSGLVSIGHPGQEVLERTSVVIAPDRIEARIDVGLPASGRRVRGREASKLLGSLLPRIANASLVCANLNERVLREHVILHRDQEWLRSQLAGQNLVAFVGDGAILPRRSGDSDLPLSGTDAIPFTSPDSMQVEFQLPSGQTVTGMGVPEGVTVIVGGGYHGKSTLLHAIERGVYPHIAGDGREWVITRADAVSIRAEDGRAVTGVDISPFITNLPSGIDTRSFSTSNASGSTSQATNLVEAIDAGASALLIDEDTSATNFMIRDERMRALIPASREPITPFVTRVRPLFTELGVSTILVAGGSGAFFDVADQVIALDHYIARNVTKEARKLISDHQDAEPNDGSRAFTYERTARVPDPSSLTRSRNQRPAKVRGATIQFAGETIDLSAMAQLVDPAQTQAIAWALDRIAGLADGQNSIEELVLAVQERVDAESLDWVSPFNGHPGHLTRPRQHELHAALSRLRGLHLAGP